MLINKYKPETIGKMTGNRAQAEEVKEWIKNPKKGHALMLYGPPGSGKTLSVEIAAKELNYELLEMDTSSIDSEYMEKASNQMSLFFRGKVLLIDNADGLRTTRGIMDIIKKSSHPVVLTADNAYDPGLRNIRNCCSLLKYDKIRWTSVAKYLREVCEAEEITYEDTALNQLSMMSNGDVRAALMDLEQLTVVSMDAVKMLGHRESEENVFETLRILFSATKLSDAIRAFRSSEKSSEELFLWIEENIPNAYKRKEEIADAYARLAVADIFRQRIMKRQAWSLQKYVISSMCGTAVYGKSYGFIRYMPPKMFRTKNYGSIFYKIGRKLHISAREAAECMPLIAGLIEKSDRTAAALGLSSDDVKMLLS
ncbi:MAG: AAA family ATPase [Candidatus Aenigmarchaeota archaeon]|nr:AAA family ATPase [Candidatus Aenigmarchaeota archaeon]